MKYVDEFRDPDAVRRYARLLARGVTRPWTLMEVCGGQTHSIVKHGIDQLLPAGITLLHGPGCPVCVTPIEIIDQAIALARRPGIIVCSFGDMLRVPGTEGDLFGARAAGGDVRMVYGPLDALKIARDHPDRQIVFFAVGFETTAPTTALAVARAAEDELDNFSLLCAHVRVPPALEALLDAEDNRVQAFLAAGHVCTVMGTREYVPIATTRHVPIVVTGFEPLDLMQGIMLAVRQLEEGRAVVENQYARSVRAEGNAAARAIVERVFAPVDRRWRGLGVIRASGLALRADYRDFDAAYRHGPLDTRPREDDRHCIAGLVLRGSKRPADCPAFGGRCTPEHPLGAPMVSSEGACSAWYRYRRVVAAELGRE
ncbi:MAG: hydrogenase formation protein HypD [Gammaproteobacteria bacterium]|nr:hydrogenase formation protein HypD [Gammaproteobacteria bacterium]